MIVMKLSQYRWGFFPGKTEDDRNVATLSFLDEDSNMRVATDWGGQDGADLSMYFFKDVLTDDERAELLSRMQSVIDSGGDPMDDPESAMAIKRGAEKLTETAEA